VIEVIEQTIDRAKLDNDLIVRITNHVATHKTADTMFDTVSTAMAKLDRGRTGVFRGQKVNHRG